jgi:hypothetical protein
MLQNWQKQAGSCFGQLPDPHEPVAQTKDSFRRLVHDEPYPAGNMPDEHLSRSPNSSLRTPAPRGAHAPTYRSTSIHDARSRPWAFGAVALRRHETSPCPRVETDQLTAFIGWTSSPSGSPVELIKGYIPLSISVKGSAEDDYSERAHIKAVVAADTISSRSLGSGCATPAGPGDDPTGSRTSAPPLAAAALASGAR